MFSFFKMITSIQRLRTCEKGTNKNVMSKRQLNKEHAWGQHESVLQPDVKAGDKHETEDTVEQ